MTAACSHPVPTPAAIPLPTRARGPMVGSENRRSPVRGSTTATTVANAGPLAASESRVRWVRTTRLYGTISQVRTSPHLPKFGAKTVSATRHAGPPSSVR